MLRFITIALIFSAGMNSAYAQSDTTGLFTTKLRSLLQVKKTAHDSTQQKTPKLDSLSRISSYQDSIPVINSAQAVKSKVDSLKQRAETLPHNLEKKIAGIKKTLSPPDTLKTDSKGVNQKLDSATATVNNKADSLRQRVNTSVGKLQEKIEGKVDKVSNGEGNLSNQNFTLPENKLSGVDVPHVEVPSTDLPITDVNQKIGLPATGEIDLPATDVKADLNLLKTDIPGPEKLEKVNELTNQVKGVDEKLGTAEKYEKEMRDLKKDASEKISELPEDAEQKLNEVNAVKEVNTELTKGDELKTLGKEMLEFQDKKLLMAEMKRKYPFVANDLLASQADKVKTAQDQLAKSKRDANRIKSVKDIFRRRSSELEGKRFYQHLVPGITWQLYTQQKFVSADFAFQLGYRFTPSLTAGIGGIYRVGFDEDFEYFVKPLRTHGYRGYVDLLLTKGFFAHAEFESLKINPRYAPPVQDDHQPLRYGSYFGLGKRVNLSYHLRGMMYGLFRVNYSGARPDVSKVSVRFGLEYMFKGRGKKKS